MFDAKLIKKLYSIFWSKAAEMVSLMKKDIKTRPGCPSQRSAVVDMDDWTSRVSLDIIGKAGFGSDFCSLNDPHTPLTDAYRAAFVFSNSKIFFILSLMTHPKLVSMLPLARNRQIIAGRNAVHEFVRDFLAKRKEALHAIAGDQEYVEENEYNDIIHAAMRTRAFTTEGLVDQSKTLLGAGHETYGCHEPLLARATNNIHTAQPSRSPGGYIFSPSPAKPTSNPVFALNSAPISPPPPAPSPSARKHSTASATWTRSTKRSSAFTPPSLASVESQNAILS